MPALNRGFAALTAQSHRHVGNRLTLCAIGPVEVFPPRDKTFQNPPNIFTMEIMPDIQTRREIARRLGLDEAKYSDESGLKSEIRRLLAAAHPDRTGGEFASEEQEAKFHELSKALQQLGSEPTGLVPISEIPALMAALRDATSPSSGPDTRLSRAEFRELAKADFHERLFLPRVGSGAVGAVSLFLLSFADRFKDDLVFGTYLSTPSGRTMVLILLINSALLFVMTWWSEQRQTSFAEWLTTDDGCRTILRAAIVPAPDGGAKVSTSGMVRAIKNLSRGGRRLLIHPQMSVASAERLAKSHLERLEALGVLRKAAGKRLDATYILDSEAIEDFLGR